MTEIRVFCRSCQGEWDAAFEVGGTNPLHVHDPFEVKPVAA